MKIRDLISQLERFDPETEIYIWDGRHSYTPSSVHVADIAGLFDDEPNLQVVLDPRGRDDHS